MSALYLIGGGLLALAVLGMGSEAPPGSPAPVIPFAPAWTRFDDLFSHYGQIFQVPFEWLKAFCMTESDLGRDPRVARGLVEPTDVEGSKSTDGKSWGIMQVTLPTAQDYDQDASAEQLNEPGYCVMIAAQHVAHLMQVFPVVMEPAQRLESIVEAYNEGEGNELKELAGTGGGFANTYRERFMRNLEKVQQGE